MTSRLAYAPLSDLTAMVRAGPPEVCLSFPYVFAEMDVRKIKLIKINNLR